MDSNKAKEKAKNLYEEIQGGVNEVIARIKELIKEGSARRLIIKNKEGEVVFQTHLAVGVSGAALVGAMAPVISAIGMFAMFFRCSLDILVLRFTALAFECLHPSKRWNRATLELLGASCLTDPAKLHSRSQGLHKFACHNW